MILRFIEFFLFKLASIVLILDPHTMLNIFDYIIYLYIQFQMDLYDQFLYTPLQTSLLPVVCKIPRTVVLRNKTYTVFTANIVSYSRTLLVIPIAVCLKYEHIAFFSLNILPLLGSFSLEINFLNLHTRYQYHTTAFLLVILHDFLDHVDGIVAKAHRQMFGLVDDPLLGGFMDAFCDKVTRIRTSKKYLHASYLLKTAGT